MFLPFKTFENAYIYARFICMNGARYPKWRIKWCIWFLLDRILTKTIQFCLLKTVILTVFEGSLSNNRKGDNSFYNKSIFLFFFSREAESSCSSLYLDHLPTSLLIHLFSRRLFVLEYHMLWRVNLLLELNRLIKRMMSSLMLKPLVFWA